MLCGEIIFAATPPAELDATGSTGLIPRLLAATDCSFAKRAFEDVSLPVMNTPIHPMKLARNGYILPVYVRAKPSVLLRPEKLAK